MSGTRDLQLCTPLCYTVIMAKIPLFGKRGLGKFAIVDDEDVVKVAGVKWHVSDSGYAVNRNNGKTIRMHRVINQTPDGLFTDHKNHNRLDNRKRNLRTVTQAENMANFPKTKGYFWNTGKKYWQVSYKGRFYSSHHDEAAAVESVKRARAGLPRPKTTHSRRKYLPRGVFYMQPMAQLNRKPYYIRPQRNGIKYFQGYFSTPQEAEAAYNNFLAKED